jgi:hypothetical protein
MEYHVLKISVNLHQEYFSIPTINKNESIVQIIRIIKICKLQECLRVRQGISVSNYQLLSIQI